MRNRITRALFTAAAAGATITTLGFAVASPAGAATAGKYFTPSGGPQFPTDANCTYTGTPSDACGMAGYVASGRDFRFAQAQITVPDHSNVDTATSTDPAMYVALDNSSNATYEYARVGIAPCPTAAAAWDIVPNQATPTDCATLTGNTSGWVVFAAVDEPTGPPTIDVNALAAATEGDGILVSAYLEPTGNSVHFVVTLPDGTTINHQIDVSGPTYTAAQALADWTIAHENGVATAPVTPTSKIRDTQFFQGRFTTLNGTRGTFDGPWQLNAIEATSNGQCPPNSDCVGPGPGTGTLIAQPSYLWTDLDAAAAGFGRGAPARSSDAFGVWRYGQPGPSPTPSVSSSPPLG
jgi:hypothetical protein